MGKNLTLRFYEELNDYLPPERRKIEFTISIQEVSSIKQLIESFNIPCSQVDLVLVNGKPVSFSYSPEDGDRISVYPVFEAFDISKVSRLRELPLRKPKFILDVHLGKLSKYLRILGFDTFYHNDYQDMEIINLSISEKRILLSRDRELMKIKKIERGYWVKNTLPYKQLKEILEYFDLHSQVQPFSLCIVCSGKIISIDKEDLIEKIHHNILEKHTVFYSCSRCDKVYWRGSHYRSMVNFIHQNLSR